MERPVRFEHTAGWATSATRSSTTSTASTEHRRHRRADGRRDLPRFGPDTLARGPQPRLPPRRPATPPRADAGARPAGRGSPLPVERPPARRPPGPATACARRRHKRPCGRARPRLPVRHRLTPATAARSLPELADRIAQEMGWLALAVAFRGCGESEGNFSLRGWLDDLQAAVRHLQSDASTSPECGSRASAPAARWRSARGRSDTSIRGVAALGRARRLRRLGLAPAAPARARHARSGSSQRAGFPSEPRRLVPTSCGSSERWRAAPQLAPRPLLVVHGSDDDLVPLFDARVHRRRPRRRRAADHQRRRPPPPPRPARRRRAPRLARPPAEPPALTGRPAPPSVDASSAPSDPLDDAVGRLGAAGRPGRPSHIAALKNPTSKKMSMAEVERDADPEHPRPQAPVPHQEQERAPRRQGAPGDEVEQDVLVVEPLRRREALEVLDAQWPARARCPRARSIPRSFAQARQRVADGDLELQQPQRPRRARPRGGPAPPPVAPGVQREHQAARAEGDGDPDLAEQQVAGVEDRRVGALQRDHAEHGDHRAEPRCGSRPSWRCPPPPGGRTPPSARRQDVQSRGFHEPGGSERS